MYKTNKAKEKFADSLISLGDKLFWYFYNCNINIFSFCIYWC